MIEGSKSAKEGFLGFMQSPGSGKRDQHESLCEELLRERAAVLSRAGFTVEDALEKLRKIESQIEERIRYWRTRIQDDSAGEFPPDRQMIFEEINSIIDQYNTACRSAEIQFYYLIVTREAMGLRRHEVVYRLYQVPPKKKKIQAI